jgi:flagellar biosynthetic protein FlhB
MSGGGEKTEKATPKRLKDLRKKGSAARSIDLPSGLALMSMVVMLPSMVTRLTEVLRNDMTMMFLSADVKDLTEVRQMTALLLTDAVRALAPGIAVIGAASLLAGVVVTRSKPNPAMLRPRFERLNPGKTIKHLVSAHSLVQLTKDTAKLTVIFVVTWGVWQTGTKELVSSGGTFSSLQAIVGQSIHDMFWRVAALALVIGFADAAWQRRAFGKQARMTKQEVIDEHKQSEGDPHTKAQIKSRMLAASRRRMIQAIPAADVVLANPTHLVVALKYLPGNPAPVVVAKGAGALAQRIKDVAAEHNVPVLADKPLARAIYKNSEVGDFIPAELFRAVAEVLAVVYAAKRRGVRPSWRSRMVTA